MKERYQKSLKMTQDSNKEDQKESSTNWTPKSKAKNGKSERVQCFICKKFHLGNCKACINCKNVKCDFCLIFNHREKFKLHIGHNDKISYTEE